MPHYDYKCEECGTTFELFQGMNEPPVTVCPSCKGKVRRLIGKGAGTIFKGSGFYQTDYKNNQSKKTESKDKSEDKPAEVKKDTKPADKSEGKDK
jgi:putative FmdB family regulatory protein